MRDVKLVNLSLLAKWKWRIFQADLPLWKLVLRDKYGDSFSSFPPNEGFRWSRFASGWWKKLMKLEDGVSANWLTNRVVRKVSNGREMSFWKDRWMGDQPLAITFPRLFSISLHKEAKVRDVWNLHNGVVSWNLIWRKQPFIWENNLVANCLTSLNGILLGEEEDRWWWLPEENGVFSVKSLYRVLEEVVLEDDRLSVEEEGVFVKLWKSLASSKVVAFSWMAIIDRIPTRANLAFRHVLALVEPCRCILCGHGEETTSHVFLHCDVASLIWRKLMDWLDFNFITPQNLFMHFACWSETCISRRILKALWLIWHAAIWIIWKERNARFFTNQAKSIDEVVDEIKEMSWCWVLSRLQIPSCLFYEWTWNPRKCLNRR